MRVEVQVWCGGQNAHMFETERYESVRHVEFTDTRVTLFFEDAEKSVTYPLAGLRRVTEYDH